MTNYKITVLLFSFFILNQSTLCQTSITIGESVVIQSDILEQERQLNIYLPQQYNPDSSSLYPVIYVLDGSLDEDFIHIAGLTQFHSFPWLHKVPPCIVVGIANVNRYHDFTYPSNEKESVKINPDNGGSSEFIAFIEQEVQPYINSHYKTDTITTLIGQSLGGLLASEILIKKPDLFDHYLIVSPSLWWDNQSLLEVKAQSYQKTKHVYIAVGNEGKVMKKVARKLFQKIKKHKNTKSKFRYFPELDHGDALHLSVYYGLQEIFKQ